MSVENPLPLAEAAAASAPAVPVATRKFRLNPRFTFEAILIVLSVLLGFGVSEWRAARIDKELAASVERNLRTEIEYNLARLEGVLLGHQALFELIQSADVSNSTQSGWDVIFAAMGQAGGGLERPVLRKGAWDAAVSTGALRLLDYELVAELSEVYAVQEELNQAFAVSLKAYQTDTFRPGLQRETVQVFRWTIEEIVNSEDALLKLYKQHLQNEDEVAPR